MTSLRSPLAVAVAVTAVAPTSAIFAADITPGNLLISTGEVLYEYTTGGVFVQTVPTASAAQMAIPPAHTPVPHVCPRDTTPSTGSS